VSVTCLEERSLRRAGHSSKGVLPSVVCEEALEIEGRRFNKKNGSYNGTRKGCQYGQMKTNRFREERIYAICFNWPAFL
jgi:hypothetical protein